MVLQHHLFILIAEPENVKFYMKFISILLTSHQYDLHSQLIINQEIVNLLMPGGNKKVTHTSAE